MDTFQSIVGILNYLTPLLALGGGLYFARRFVQALERRADNKAELTELRARVAQLEETQEAAERDIVRLQTAQEFSAQLLANRMAAVLPSSDTERAGR